MWQKFLRSIPMKFLSLISLTLLILWYVHYASTRPRPVVEPNAVEQTWQSDLQTESSKDSTIAVAPIAKPRTPNAESTRTQLANSLANLGGKIQELRALRTQVGVRLEEVQDSESGRRIAASSEHFPLLIALIQHHDDSEIRVNQIADRYSELVAAEVGGMTDAEHRKTLGLLPEFEEALARATKEFHDVELSILTIEHVCKSIPPAPKSAKVLIAERKQAEVDAASALMKSATIAAKQSQDSGMAEKIQEKTEADLLLRVAKEQLEKAKENSKILDKQIESELVQKRAALRETMKRIELEFQRDKSKIDRYLEVLMIDGYNQPESSGYQTNEATPRKVSLTKLIGCGALNNTQDGLYKLALAMTVGNDRYKNLHGSKTTILQQEGNYPFAPKFGGGTFQIGYNAYYSEAQKLLLKYQFLLVEKGLLSE